MAIFPNSNVYYMGRTHTSLVVSEGNAPAEKYIPSATEAVKFQYHFGPENNQNVVIAKGKAVALAGVEWDIESEHYVPALCVANGTSKKTIGVNHHNVYERIRDRFSGNQPTVITREYIEVPMFPSKDYANAIKFGAAWVSPGGTPTAIDYANAIIGKPIAVDEFGNYTVADGTYTDVIGTCYGVETDLPPAGYLQYFLEMNDTEYAALIKQMSLTPSPGRTTNGDFYDVGTYPLGSGYLKSKEDLMRKWKEGIPFLTDGYFRSRTVASYKLGDANVVPRTSGNVTIASNKLAVTDPIGAAIFIKIPDTLAQDAMKTGMAAGPEFAGTDPSDIKVYLTNDGTAFKAASSANRTTALTEAGLASGADGGTTALLATQVSPANIHVDYTNNMIVVYLTNVIAADAATVENEIVIDATVLQNQIPGIPTGWDFKNGLGAVRILLQK